MQALLYLEKKELEFKSSIKLGADISLQAILYLEEAPASDGRAAVSCPQQSRFRQQLQQAV